MACDYVPANTLRQTRAFTNTSVVISFTFQLTGMCLKITIAWHLSPFTVLYFLASYFDVESTLYNGTVLIRRLIKQCTQASGSVCLHTGFWLCLSLRWRLTSVPVGLTGISWGSPSAASWLEASSLESNLDQADFFLQDGTLFHQLEEHLKRFSTKSILNSQDYTLYCRRCDT